MRRLETILLAGTLLAIPMLPPFSGVAISQSTVNNNQSVQTDITASQTLNVVDTSDSSTSIASATGNGMLSGTESGSLDVQSIQSMPANVTGNISAVSHMTIQTNGGEVTSLAASTGNNYVDTSVGELGGGALTGNLSQSAGPNWTVKSETDFQAPNAQASDASIASQAIANSMGFSVSNATANVTTQQTNSATVDAEGGSELNGGSGATLGNTMGTVAYSTAAVGNNLTGNGIGVASQTINTTQVANGPLVQAAGFVNVGNGQTVEGDATASANNVAVTNAGGPLVVVDSQENDTHFTHAQSVASDFEFGTGQATAFGVGNSVLAGNQGPSTELDNTQVNTGGIQAQASFTGDAGFDATSSATAMGNAAIGFACSQCGGVISINNSQVTSGGGVEADSTTSITNTTGNNRSTTGIATAVGNNGTFYVTHPNN
jgi:hypothetical protein